MNIFKYNGNGIALQNDPSPARRNHLIDDSAPDAGAEPARPLGRFEPVDLGFYKGLFEFGEERAIQSGATEIKPEDEEPLIRHAQAMALVKKLELSESSDDADRLREEESAKHLADRQEAETVEKHTAAELQTAEEVVAEKKPGLPPCSPPRALRIAATVFIALTLAVTLHDQVFAFGDDVTAWLCSALVGGLCGWFVTHLILYNSGTEASTATIRRAALIAGIGIGIGLFALRVAAAQSFGSIIFALGMTILEIGAVIGLHSVAEQYRAALKEFRERELVAMKAEAARDVIKHRLVECREQLAQLETKIQQHLQYLNERRFCQQHVAELEALAVSGVRDGYAAGVAFNVGKLRNANKSRKGINQ